MMTANADQDAVRRELLHIIGFSRKSIDLIVTNTHVGFPEQYDVRHRYQSSCGDMIDLALRIVNGRIVEAGFNYAGCAGLQAAAVGMVDLVTGMELSDARLVDEEAIIGHLEGLPENRRVCADWARDALRATLDVYAHDHTEEVSA
jgi:nitrogen fixation NifU-like protein